MPFQRLGAIIKLTLVALQFWWGHLGAAKAWQGTRVLQYFRFVTFFGARYIHLFKLYI